MNSTVLKVDYCPVTWPNTVPVSVLTYCTYRFFNVNAVPETSTVEGSDKSCGSMALTRWAAVISSNCRNRCELARVVSLYMYPLKAPMYGRYTQS